MSVAIHVSARIFFFLILFGAVAAHVHGCHSAKELKQMKQAEDLIDRFRRGEGFSGDIACYLDQGHVEHNVLAVFARALHREDAPVREEVARLLVNIGRQIDPLHAQGANLLRDKAIVQILLKHGLCKEDFAREYCLDMVLELVPTDSLKEYCALLTEDLTRWPCGSSFLLAAKVKCPEASRIMEVLIKSPEWSTDEKAEIAMAALGDTTLERKFISRFLETRDPVQKSDFAFALGYIGSRPALSALASEMRTDLIIVVEHSYKRSVRLDIMQALRHNYLDNLFLQEEAISDDSGYTLVEHFCEQTFGTRWLSPRPPFLSVEGFPSLSRD